MAMNWRRKLSYPLKDKHDRELLTLHDARAYVLRARRPGGSAQQWRHAGKLMLEAAKGHGIKACTDQIPSAAMRSEALPMAHPVQV
jgi:citrate lyase beta subunit